MVCILTGGLRNPSIILRSLKVVLASTFKVQVSSDVKRETVAAVHRLGLTIMAGNPVADTYYRRNRYTTPDSLLTKTGIMHIHPRGPGTNELLFLIQYEKSVLFLEVSDHDHFAIFPSGHLLLAVHQNSVLDQEREAERLERQRQEAWNSET